MFKKPHINLIAEIGINHNGNLDDALAMIDRSQAAGFDYVKFQKRNPDVCVPDDQKNKEKEVPWKSKPITYLEYKHDIEFNEEYWTIDQYCNDIGMKWFVSVWDLDSAEFMKQFNLELIKVPSALLVNHELIQYCQNNFPKVMVSTGMSTQEEIDAMLSNTLGPPNILMHTNCCYPTDFHELHLDYLSKLFGVKQDMERLDYKVEVGYSNHCQNELALYLAALWDITWLETHVTLDQNMWGSDQQASFELDALQPIIHNIRLIEETMDLRKFNEPIRFLYPGEEIKRKSLRGY